MKHRWWAALGAGWVLGAAAADFDCMNEPTQVVEVRSPVVGLIERMHVTRGQSIQRGDLLVSIESSLEFSAEQTARYKAQTVGSLQQAQAQAQAQAKVEVTRAKAHRMQALFDEEFVPGQARDDALAEYEQAQSELLTAQENNRMAQLEHRQAKDRVQRRVLRSPFDGVVMGGPGAGRHRTDSALGAAEDLETRPGTEPDPTPRPAPSACT